MTNCWRSGRKTPAQCSDPGHAMSDLKAAEGWAAPLIEHLSKRELPQLAASIARDLRRQQVATIRAQRNPDGSAKKPRKHSACTQRGQDSSKAQARTKGQEGAMYC
jgi:hypothetical protein